ncbi:MAG: DNA polymerase IV [Deltaproteobacteria bacterium]
MATIILHADMDAFFASVEQLDDPSIRGKAVIVGGITGKRGVVAASSYEARRFGVRSAMPMVEAKRRCPDGVYLRSRMSRYAELSAVVREVFYRFTPVVEPLSLDEAYLDIEGSLKLFGSPRDIGEQLRAAVRRETGLACSVGVGPGKLVAKIASERAKPDGLLVVEQEARKFLAPLRVSEIWGVGKRSEATLHEMGIATIGQLAEADPDQLEQRLGKWGPVLSGLARGQDLRTVEGDRARKSYGEENTFLEDATDRELIEATVIAHAETVARRLRRDGRQGRTVTLKFRPSTSNPEFRVMTRSKTLHDATDDGRVLTRIAMALWDAETRKPPLRLLGVQVSGLDGERPVQLGLFRAPEDERHNALNQAVDEIVSRFGSDSLRRGRRS